MYLREVFMAIRSIRLLSFFVIYLFTNPSFAEIDVVVSGGMKRFNGTTVNMPSQAGPKTDWENHAWIFDTDILYKVSLRFSIGVRYQHLLSSGRYARLLGQNVSSAGEAVSSAEEAEGDFGLLQTFRFNAGRLALLGRYRFYGAGHDREGFFMGLLVALDAFKFLSFDMRKTEEESSVDKTITQHTWLWERLTGQVGLELGFQWTHFFLKAEVGYGLFSFSNFRCESDTNQCATHSPEDIFNFNSFYGMLGIGYAFK